MKENKSIKTLSLEDRPREKLLQKGVNNLTNAELLAILLGSGNSNENAVELSQRILNDYQNKFNELSKCNIDGLLKYKGIGTAKAVTIAAAMEIGRRRKQESGLSKPKITCSTDIANIVAPVLDDIPQEKFLIILLSRSNEIIHTQTISIGTTHSTVIDVKIILKAALDKLASSIILCHNHPSGNLNPSKQDIQITEKISKAAELFDIKVLDHIIIASNKHYSFADNGIL